MKREQERFSAALTDTRRRDGGACIISISPLAYICQLHCTPNSKDASTYLVARRRTLK